MRSAALVLAGLILVSCSMPLTRQMNERYRAEQLVARAEEMTRAGNYPAAHESYRRALEEYGKADPADRALFGLARLYAAPGNPGRDYRQAYESFERLLKEYPQSQWAGEARAWRDVLAALLVQREEAAALRREAEYFRQEAQRIRQDLGRLKQLELELERQRRR